MNDKVRILSLYGNTVYYGHERSNIQVFHTLNSLGYDLLVLVNKKGIAEPAKEVLENDGIAYSPIIYPDWKDMRKPFTVVKFLKYLGKMFLHNISFIRHYLTIRPDFIYIANDFMYVNLIPAFLVCRCRIIYRIGDAPVVQWKPFDFFWRKFIVKRTYKFVYISEYIRRRVLMLGRDGYGDNVIYNYPPIRISAQVNPIPYEKRCFTFSYLGQIIEIKGVALFVEAALIICKQTPDVKFLIAGDLNYDVEFSKRLIFTVEKAGFPNRILFLDTVQNIADFFAKTDVLITPSIKEEPLGNVIVEAKQNKVPAIIFPSGGMPELIQHKTDGYICREKDLDSLVEALDYYLSDRAVAPIQGENAFRSMQTLNIGYDHFVQKWKKTIEGQINEVIL
jgi:glycosyltransferase involved in cell wall biosynthesis